MPPKTKKYCCMCSNFRGKIVDSRVITLHRFPANERIKKVWLQRCKLVMKTFKYTQNSFLCSDRFEGKAGTSPLHSIPTLFGHKNFKISKLDENQEPEIENLNDADETSVLCSVSVHAEYDEGTSSNPNHDTGTSTSFAGSPSILDSSVRLHDYCKDLPSLSVIRHQYIQTHVYVSDACTQTDEVSSLTVNWTQTDTVQTNEIEVQVNLPQLTYEDIKDDDQKISFYTGIPDRVTFDTLFEDIVVDADEGTGRATRSAVGRPRSLNVIDEFLLVLMRLRLGLLLEDLAYRFCISTTACGKLVNKWIDYLDEKLSFLVMWTSREVIDANMPEAFKEKFPNTRVIIDCTEIHTETPHSLQLKSLLYSDYKSHMTWKSLIGINPSGIVTFVSDLWSGSISDKKITQESGLIDLCEPGDAIMADKGFTIADLTTPKGVSLIIPPFKQKRTQMPKRDVKKTRDIVNVRIHVEREMERIKNFRILQGVMPISMSKRASKVWKICVRLTNLQPPLVPMKCKRKNILFTK